MTAAAATCLFVDIGGVLLTNGWDHRSRQRAAKQFQLDYRELEERHKAVFNDFELGKLTLEQYLTRVIFNQQRSFTRPEFRRFMYAQSLPLPGMIPLISRLKASHHLKVVAVSNESRELNARRIRTFRLASVIDFFVSSCFVKLRKPDPDIFRLALDMAQVRPEEVVYLDNTEEFVHIGEGLGIRSLLHSGYRSTCAGLDVWGLRCDARSLSRDPQAITG